MRVLCTGSRSWDHVGSITFCLDVLLGEARAIGEQLVVVHGACPTGADAIVEDWCRESIHAGRPVRVERHPAKWSVHGRQAGFIRNADMVRLGADVCIAWIRDESAGATHCAEEAEKCEIEVRVIDYATVTE